MTDEVIETEVLTDPGLDDDAFDESETKTEEAEVEEEKVETKAETEEEDAEEEETTASEPKSVPVAALKDERKKRQAAEEESKRLKDELQKLQSKPEPVSDDKFGALVEVTAEIMREEHKDYPEMESIFMDLISTKGEDNKLVITDLKLYEQYRAAKNPAKFVYNHAKKHQEFLEKTSPDYEKKLEERIRNQILADLKKSGRPPELPDLTSTAASQANTEDPEPKGDDDGIWD